MPPIILALDLARNASKFGAVHNSHTHSSVYLLFREVTSIRLLFDSAPPKHYSTRPANSNLANFPSLAIARGSPPPPMLQAHLDTASVACYHRPTFVSIARFGHHKSSVPKVPAGPHRCHYATTATLKHASNTHWRRVRRPIPSKPACSV